MIPYYETRPEDFFAFTTSDAFFPLHLHFHMEIQLVLEGSFQVTVDGETKILNKSDMAVIFPNCVHGRNPVNEDENARVAVIAVKPFMAGEFDNTILNFLPSKPFVLAEEMPSQAIFAYKELIKLQETRPDDTEYYNILVHSYVQIILATVLPKLDVSRNSHPEYYVIQKAISYIYNNFSQPLSLEKVASHVGVSRCHLSTVFSKHMHIGYKNYLDDVRLNYARKLLEDTDDTILSISYESGFNSLRTFNRIFEKTFDMSPNQFRKSSRNRKKIRNK